MLVLVIVLIVTNLVTLGTLGWYLLRPVEHPSPDASLAASLAARRHPAVSTSSPRRVITIEILNAIELAGRRGRWIGIAGSLAPGLTRRIVYDHAIRLVRTELAKEHVAADVRLHIVHPDEQLPRMENHPMDETGPELPLDILRPEEDESA